MGDSIFTEEHHEQAENASVLGAEYFGARDAAERFLAHWTEEHAADLANSIVKPIVDDIQEKVNDAFRDWLLRDAENNAASVMRRMVEDSVRALIGGRKWANVKYISTESYRGEEVRKTLAQLYSDEIKDARISDLEKQVSDLEKRLEWLHGR